MTELWFLQSIIDSAAGLIEFINPSIQDSKFGYDECYIDIGDQRYLIKHKTWRLPYTYLGAHDNIIFYVHKFSKKK